MVYADDVVLFSCSEKTLDEVTNHFKSSAEIKMLTLIEGFLGFTVPDIGHCMKLHNGPMVERLFKHFNLKNCRFAKTPLQPYTGLDLGKETGDVLTDETPYQQLLGALPHVAKTVRPVIAFCCELSSQIMREPTTLLCKTGRHVLCYLKQCPDIGICYRPGGANKIEAYSDANWGKKDRLESGSVEIC